MNTHCEMKDSDWDSLALGCLETSEAAPLLAHLKSGCEVCGSIYGEALVACQAMGAGLAGQAPSQVVEDRLAAYTRRKPRSTAWAPWLVAAASLALAAYMGTRERPVQVVAVNAPAPEPIVKVETKTTVVDPNPALQKRIAELEARPKEIVEPTVIERVRVVEKPATIVKVEDPEKDKQLQAARAQIQQLEEQLATRVAGLEVELKRQRLLVDDYRNAFRTIESTGMRQVELAVVDAAAGRGGARALYSQQGGLLVLAHDLPKLPGQNCYQVWILRKGNPTIVSGGLMKLDDQGRGILQSPPTAALKDATGFAITDEPPGGSVVARGRKLLFGAL